jgi:hypothetical protein
VSAQSATGFVTLGVLGLVIAVRRIWRRAGAAGKGLSYYAVAAICAAIVLVWQGRAVIDALFGALPAKLATESFVNRLASDAAGIRILLQTLGLGAGLGSNRSSSLATTLLSCVGIIGSAAFAVLVVQAIRSSLREPETRLAGWGLISLLVAQMVAQPDLSTPLLWFLLGVCLGDRNASITHPVRDGDEASVAQLPVASEALRGFSAQHRRMAPGAAPLPLRRPSPPPLVPGPWRPASGELVPGGSDAVSRRSRRLS